MDWARFAIYPAGSQSREEAEALASSITCLADRVSAGYIWDKDSFSVQVGSSPTLGLFLHGKLDLGENADDEWFLVSLLYSISVSYPDAVIKVQDQDGEFLLIEAADVIPDWLEPETSANRIFLCNGKLCIASIEAFPENPKLEQAISWIRADPFRSFASKEVQRSIKDRIKIFEGGFSYLNHRAYIVAPVTVCAVIKEEPRLLTLAINLFCSRKDKPFSIESSPLRLSAAPKTRTLASFSKPQFAKLAFQQYFAPKSGYAMPEASSPDFVPHDLGLKVAAGLDLFMRDAMADSGLKKRALAIIEGVDLEDPSRYTVHGVEDGTKWMDVDPAELDQDLADASETFRMSEGEISELMKDWDNEYDNPQKASKTLKKSVTQLKSFLERMSLHEGVDVDTDEGSDVGLDDRDTDGDSEGELEEDSEGDAFSEDSFLEFEILETLKHDPDLLMRIVEMNAHSGNDSSALMEKLQKMVEAEKTEGSRKKGVADIDPAKLEEALKKPYRRLPDEVDRQNEQKNQEESTSEDNSEQMLEGDLSDFESSSSEDDVAVHTPTLKELYRTVPIKEVVLLEESDNAGQSMQDYYSQMDAELSTKLTTADFSDISHAAGETKVSLAARMDAVGMEYNLSKCLADIEMSGDRSGAPTTTILASMMKKSPVNTLQ